MRKIAAAALAAMSLPAAVLVAPSTAIADPRTSTPTQVSVTEYVLPPGPEAPFGISPGPANSVWFGAGDYVGRVTPRGRVVTYRVPSRDANVGWVQQGPDGALWFAERGTNKIGRTDARGRMTETTLPTPDSAPQALVFDRRGRLWYTGSEVNKLGRIDTNGSIREFPVPTSDALPLGMVMGPDNALWFTERNAEKIGRFDLATETFTEYPLTQGANPQRIVLGRDGALWFSEAAPSKIGRITTGGTLTEYPVPAGPVGIVADREGLWFAEYGTARIGRISYSGVVMGEYQVPTPNSHPIQITVAGGRVSGVWVTEQAVNRIARLQLGPAH